MADDTNWTRAAAYIGLGLLLVGGISYAGKASEDEGVNALLVAMHLHGWTNGITWEAGHSCRTGLGPEGLPLNTTDMQTCRSTMSVANNLGSITNPTERQLLQVWLNGYNSASGINPYIGTAPPI